jgi:thiol-disulfide isomerase/thioredoxin
MTTKECETAAMSKTNRGKAPSAGQEKAQGAREKVAAQRARARRGEVRRRALIVGASLALVLAVAIGFIVVRVTAPPARAGAAVSDAAVAQQVASVPAATFDAVGAGTAAGLQPVSGEPELTMNGKPEVLYMGGEYCPYCAAERWAIAAALSRFGTLSGVQFIQSSPTDAYPSTPTLSFANARYASKYLSFVPVELYSEKPDASTPTGYAYLQQPTSQQAALLARYGGGSIPFVDIGNRYVVTAAQYLPSALAGLTWSQVASAMHDPNSPVARDIDGAANMITAAICKLTHGQPAGLGSSAGVTAAARSI